jgi:polyribonucleotide nucleotidyltransferase
VSIKIDEDDIRVVIWKWWEMIQKITKEFEVEMDVEDNWLLTITASNQENWNKAINFIKNLLEKPEVWKIYEWKVVKVLEIWVIVNFLTWKDWLVHISKVSNERITKEQLPAEWEEVRVKLMEAWNDWRFSLSIKDAK